MNIKKKGISIYLKGNEEGTPVIFVHGFPFDHLMWDNQINLLSSDYFCVTYDVRGLGESDPGDGQYTIELFVDDLEMVIDELKLKEPVICGFSMGGYITLRALERMTKKFRGIILCDTRSGADTNEGKINRAAGIQKINSKGVKSFVGEFITNCFCNVSLNTKKETVANMISGSEFFSAAGIKGCLLAMAARTDTTGVLGAIRIPALLLCGEEDTLTPKNVMMEMASKIEKSEFHVIPGAGHLSPVENPGEVNKQIINFLKKIK